MALITSQEIFESFKDKTSFEWTSQGQYCVSALEKKELKERLPVKKKKVNEKIKRFKK